MLKGLENIPMKVDHETGEEIFILDCIVDSQRRHVKQDEDQGEEEEDQEGEVLLDHTVSQDAGTDNDDGLVRDNWRLISAVKTWPTTSFFLPQCVDYSHNYGKVLRQAIPLINENRPDLTWDHSYSSRDIAGHIENARWEKSKDIPPGVNATLVVDPDFDRQAAIGLEKAALRNGSIGLTMELKKSHPEMEFGEFVEKQGQIVDDEEVRWFPSSISDVRHMAIVPAGAGADPNAGRRVSAAKTITQTKQDVGGKEMNEFVALLCQICERMGLAVALDENHPIPESLPEKMIAHLDKYEGVYEKHNDLVLKLTSIGEKYLTNEEDRAPTVAELVAVLPDKLDLAAQADEIIRHQRSEALRLFDLAKLQEGKEDFTPAERRMRERIETSSNLEFLNDMIAEYAPIAEEKFGRRSSVQDELPDVRPENPEFSGRDREIRDSVKRLFPKKETK